MLTLPDAIVPLLAPSRRCSTARLGSRPQLLPVSAVLFTGQRTARRSGVMGRSGERDYPVNT